MTKSHYLTARCPQGCETWLHPRAVWAHTNDSDRCRQHPWVDDIADTALIAAPLAQKVASVLPGHLVGLPGFSCDRVLHPNPGDYLRIDLCQGIVVQSPVEGVMAQRWAIVVAAAERAAGGSVIERAMTAAGFAEIEQRLTEEGRLARCPDCGATATARGMTTHRARNTPCRWRRAAAEVSRLWAEGWRDPFSVPEAPLKLAELRASVAWRRRLHLVPFPAWTAVLLRDGAMSVTRQTRARNLAATDRRP